MKSLNGFVVGALAVAVAVLGYLYYQETRKTVVEIDLPKVQIK